MEIKKEKLSWIENVVKKTTQIDADLDVIVPDSKPDIKKILQIDANVETTNCELQNDRILLCGNVYFNVIYMPEDVPMMQSIRVTAPFTDIVAVNGVTPEMDGILKADILSVNYRIINGRKFSVKSVVEAEINVNKTMTIESVSEISGSDIQVKNSHVEFLTKSGQCCKNIVINEKIIIPDTEPAIGEMLNVSAKVNEYSIKLINNKAILKGDAKIMCTYADAVAGDVFSVNTVVPFTEIFDIDGIRTDDLCNAMVETTICEYNCVENSAGEVRSVETKSVLSVNASVMRDEKCVVVGDCYATDKRLDIVTVDINLPQKINNVDHNDTIKTNITVADNEPMVKKVYDVFSKAYIDSVEPSAGRVSVNGVIDNYILYVTKDDSAPIYCIKNEVEFCHTFDCGICDSPDGSFCVEALNTSYVLNSEDSVELRINYRINGIIYNVKKTKLITDIIQTDIKTETEKTSIVVYFVQDNETLWDVAKKYFTTTDTILKVNELPDGEVEKGMRLLIPKNKRA